MSLALVSVSTLHLQFIWFRALLMFLLLKEDLTTSLTIKVDSFPQGHQKWDKTSKARSADDPKFFCWWGNVPRNLWFTLYAKKTEELLSSAHSHVYRLYSGTVRQPNQSACCYEAM